MDEMNSMEIITRQEASTATGLQAATVTRHHWEDLSKWLECREAWLKAMREESGRENTAKAYARDWAEFVEFVSRMEMPRALWEVDGRTAAAWKEHLIGRGLADTSANRKLAALSSFYSFAGSTFLVDIPGQLRATPLWPLEFFGNPFHQIKRIKISKNDRKGRRDYPKPDETHTIFDKMMPLRTPTDWRDMAILFGTYMTTRRYSEWVTLQWRNVHEGEDGFYFDFVNKGGESDEQYLEPELYQLIVRYLREAGRWPLEPDDYIFVALSDKARRLRKATQIVMQAGCVLLEWTADNGAQVEAGEAVARIRFGGYADGVATAGSDGELRIMPEHQGKPDGSVVIGKVLGAFVLDESYETDAQPMSNHSANAMFKRRATKAGVDLTKAHLHGLRHCRANKEWKRDPKHRDIVYLKELLNHASLSTTELYGQESFNEPEDYLSATAWGEMAPEQLKFEIARGIKGA